jgi:ribose transport system permease protein
VLPRSLFGRYAYAIGSSARAAKLAGVPVGRWRLAFYATCGLLAAVAGVVTVARTGTAQPSANLGIELDVITAVILGGTSLTGGRGRLAGTFLGLLLIATLNNGLILISVESYWQQVVKGVILLVAVFWDELRRTRRDEA